MTKTIDIKLLPSSVATFTEALWGDSGSLDAWLEANDESEVAEHIEAYASACVSSAIAEKDAEIDRLRTRLEETAHVSANKTEELRTEMEVWKASFEQASAGHATYAERTERLTKALAELITWIPSADTYRRLGFDPDAPMRALREAKAALERNGQQ